MQPVNVTSPMGLQLTPNEWLWELCGWLLLNHDDLMLGGSGPVHPNVVQIDESCFSHKPNVHYYIEVTMF